MGINPSENSEPDCLTSQVDNTSPVLSQLIIKELSMPHVNPLGKDP